MYKRLLIPAALLLLLFVLTAVFWDVLSPMNTVVRSFVATHLYMWFYPVAITLHYSFETVLGTVQTLFWAAVVFFVYKAKSSSFLLIAVMLVQTTAVNTIKALTAIPRPPQEFFGVLHHNFSFPSGHACTSATLAIMLGYILICKLKRKEGVPIAFAYGAVALVTAYSRMYLDVHWVLDVIGGLLFAGFISLLAAFLDQVLDKRSMNADKVFK